MKTYVLYHANCPDGFAAAWVAWLLFRDDATYIPVFYGEPVPATITEGSRIFILDFSYKRTILESLSMLNHVVVLDHHSTAKAELDGLPGLEVDCPLRVHFDTSQCGAVLAWRYFFPDKAVPEILLYVQDRDLWQWQLPSSREINAALSIVPRDFVAFTHAVESIPKLMHDGFVALQQIEKIARVQASFAFTNTVGGYTVPVANVTAFHSETCHQMLEEHPDAPFVAVYRDQEGKRIWSLRSRPDFDCSVIAKELGGGGHPQACGFEEELHSIVGDFEQGGCIAITRERQRQIQEEGYSAAHDDGHRNGSIAQAAACYAETAALQIKNGLEQSPPCFFHKDWPWEREYFQARDPRRNLVKAGALIAAEIDRLDRREAAFKKDPIIRRAMETFQAEITDTTTLRDMLELVGENVPLDVIEAWTGEQRSEVEEWCTCVHFNASDNPDVKVPARPACVDAWKGVQP